MGINNIHILINEPNDEHLAHQAQLAYQQHLIEAHHRGEHPWGSMRRDCPICQRN